MITVSPGDPRDPAATALLAQSHALMQSLFPAEDNHYLEVSDLCAPDIRFFVARDDGKTIGCAALALREGYGELKSMFVDPSNRGSGAADALMHRLEQEARAQGLTDLKLETGNTLHAAHRVYTRHGFTPCGPFAQYEANASSLFMAKRLA
ncbi:MAG: GNAT family N-acetyltransferase [Rhodobacter sp.]|nr:GNAT family N-acetyltransferase [Rhodobacter sp.]